MNATVAEPTTEPTEDERVNQEAFERSSTAVVFLSRRSELRLIRVPRYPILAAGSGRQTGEEPGECVNFVNNQFVCPREGQVALEDGRKVDAAELLEWLEEHRLHGDVNGGFWRVDPTAPAISQAELEALIRAADEHDEEALVAIIEAERAGWQREGVLKVAEGSLERVRKVSELLAREQEIERREAALAAGESPAGQTPAAPETPAAPAAPESALLAAEQAAAAAATTDDDPEEPQA